MPAKPTTHPSAETLRQFSRAELGDVAAEEGCLFQIGEQRLRLKIGG
jgi:hypothetical protein